MVLARRVGKWEEVQLKTPNCEMSQSHPHPTLQLLYKMTETLEQSMSGPCPCPVCRNRYDMKPVGSQMSRKLSWVEVRTINVLLQSRGSSYNIPNPPEVEYVANNNAGYYIR